MIGIVARGRDRSGRHYDRGTRFRGTVMRHFLLLARTPPALAGRMATRAAVAQLIADTGAVQ